MPPTCSLPLSLACPLPFQHVGPHDTSPSAPPNPPPPRPNSPSSRRKVTSPSRKTDTTGGSGGPATQPPFRSQKSTGSGLMIGGSGPRSMRSYAEAKLTSPAPTYP